MSKEADIALYQTLIDGAQQAPQSLALHPMLLDGKPVRCVMMKVALRDSNQFDWMPLAILTDENITARLRTKNGQVPTQQSPYDYDSRFIIEE